MVAKTILIADDDSDLADVLAVRCRQLGLRVLLAYDGLSALTLIDQQTPDVVCLDVNMPRGSGMDVCRMLAADATLARIPVIVLTCRTDGETIRRCRFMGAHYVYKSTSFWDSLEPIIQDCLDTRSGNPSERNEPADQGARPGSGVPAAATPTQETRPHGDKSS